VDLEYQQLSYSLHKDGKTSSIEGSTKLKLIKNSLKKSLIPVRSYSISFAALPKMQVGRIQLIEKCAV
jgi:hypothetical protein